jgi:aspartate 1-decarboxylase
MLKTTQALLSYVGAVGISSATMRMAKVQANVVLKIALIRDGASRHPTASFTATNLKPTPG